MTGIIRITLKSDLCAGSGEAAGTTVDRDISIRDSGLPCIPARRLKGCLLDAAQWLKQYGQASQQVIETVFGTNTGVTGAIRVRDALLPGTEAMEVWLSGIRNPLKNSVQPLQWAAQPLNVESLFTSVRGQTRLVDGVAADGSLRTTRVLNRYNAMDWERETVLEAKVRLSAPDGSSVTEEEMASLLEKCCQATRHIGSSRNRGLGNVRMEWQSSPRPCAEPENGKQNGANPENVEHEKAVKPEIPTSAFVEIRYTVSLDAPVSLPGNGKDYAEIPARSVIGCVSRTFLRTGKAEGPLFRALFLNGDMENGGAQWSALTPVIDGRRSVPAPLCLAKMKNDRSYRNLLIDRFDSGAKRSQLSDYYAVPIEDGFLLAEPKSHTKYHHSHGEDGTLYMQESLDAGMLYSGTVTVPRAMAGRVLDLLAETEFAFGRSRSAQYAVCSLAKEKPIEIAEVHKMDQTPLTVGGTLYAVLESDLVLTRNGVYTADNAAVRTALTEALGIQPIDRNEQGFPLKLRDYCQYHIIGGFQEQWHLQKPQIPAVAAGSVYCFHVSKSEIRHFQVRSKADGRETVSRYITMGEFQQEGFGRVRIYTAEDMKRRTNLVKKDAVERSSRTSPDAAENSSAVKKLETALLEAAGLDALRKSARAYFESIRREYQTQMREKGAWLRTGTIGRLRLMLAESGNYREFLSRVDGMRESDINAQKTRSEREKALELVMRFCAGDRAYAAFQKSANAAQDSNPIIRKIQGEWEKALETALKQSGGGQVRANAMLAWCSEDEKALADTIAARPDVQKQVEEHWQEAVRYLLYIAYYDRKAR